MRISTTFTMLALALAIPALPAGAQILPRSGAFGGPARWSPIVAARAGWSLRDSSPSLGAELRAPVPIPGLRPSIAVSADAVFQSGLVEAQGAAEGTLGVLTPFFFGGGPAVLNSVFEDSGGARETRMGYVLVAGVRGGRMGPLTTEIAFRYLHVSDLHPRFLMLSFGYPVLGLLGG